jgi:hypothetical protein
MKKGTQVFEFQPVGADRWDRRANQPTPGTLVRKVQPHGCPRNGTMGHCFVEDADTGTFYGLVLLNSLQKATKAGAARGKG